MMQGDRSGSDASRPIAPDLELAAEHRIAASANAPETPRQIIEATVANGKDVLPVPADPHSIRSAIENDRTPVVVSGDVAGQSGKPTAEWIAVEGFDRKTHDFVIAEPDKHGTAEWTPDQLKAFIAGDHGGDAMAIAARPDDAASQRQIDAILAVVAPANRAAACTAVPMILDECQRLGITDQAQVAYILATAEREANFGRALYHNSVPLVEDPNPASNKDPVGYFNRQYGDDAGNRSKVDGVGTNDGYNYRGRGMAQITHRDSYATASANDGFPAVVVGKEPPISLNIDKEIAAKTPVAAFVARPELAAREDIAVQNLAEGMRDGWYGVRLPLGDFVHGAHRDFIDARKTINGLDAAREIAGRAQQYLDAIDSATKTPEPLQTPLHSKHAGIDPASVRSVKPWNGEEREGTVVSFSDGNYGMHVGRGSFVSFDFNNDLGGRTPIVGQFGSVSAQGLTQTVLPEQRMSQDHGRD